MHSKYESGFDKEKEADDTDIFNPGLSVQVSHYND